MLRTVVTRAAEVVIGEDLMAALTELCTMMLCIGISPVLAGIGFSTVVRLWKKVKRERI